MKKKTTFNILIAALSLVVVGCGVMALGTFNGWFQEDDITEAVSEQIGTSHVQEETENASQNAPESSSEDEISTCTICIKCSDILKHMDGLDAGKEKYVPSNGIILSTSTIEFNQGESVYDILKRSSSAAGIPVSARKSSYGVYIEGINGLFEFDCGGASGWKYSVNGKTPGHSCSSHKVKNGDSIVWYYTCGN